MNEGFYIEVVGHDDVKLPGVACCYAKATSSLKNFEDDRQNKRQEHEDNPQVFDDSPGDMPCVCGHFGARVKWWYLCACVVVFCHGVAFV